MAPLLQLVARFLNSSELCPDPPLPPALQPALLRSALQLERKSFKLFLQICKTYLLELQ